MDIIKTVYGSWPDRDSVDKNIIYPITYAGDNGKILGTTSIYSEFSRGYNRTTWPGVCRDNIIPIGGRYTNDHSRKDKNEYEERQRGGFHGRFFNRIYSLSGRITRSRAPFAPFASSRRSPS
jgi:hypothetical protein